MGVDFLPQLEDWSFIRLLQPASLAEASLGVHLVGAVCQEHWGALVDLKEGAVLGHKSAVTPFKGHPFAIYTLRAHQDIQNFGPPA